MPALYTTLQLTDGTTTLDLVDGTNYALVLGGWSPAVAPRHTSQLGGASLYEDVEEEITLDIYGTTAAIALANLANLTEMIDQAARWNNGEDEEPVVFEVQPQGSDLADAVKAVVTGGPARSGSLNLPVTFNDLLMVYTIENVRLRFTRRGLWLGPEETVTSAAVANPGMVAVSFGTSAAIPSPVKVRLAGFTGGANPTTPRGYIAMTDADGKLWKYEAEDGGAASGTNANVATAPDAARYASGNIVTYTVTGIGSLPSMLFDLSLLTARDFNRVAIFAALENASGATYTFTLRTWISGGGYSQEILTATIDDTTGDNPTQPQIVYLGTIPYDPDTMTRLEIDPTSYAATGTLSFDYLLAVGLSPSGRVLAVEDTTTTAFANASLIIDHRLDSDPQPRVIVVDDTALDTPEARVDYRGDPVFMPTGSRVSVFYIGNDPQYWVMLNDASTAARSYTLHATRRLGYLVPQ